MKTRWMVCLTLYQDDEDGCKSRNEVQVGPYCDSANEAQDWFAALRDYAESRCPDDEEPMGRDSQR